MSRCRFRRRIGYALLSAPGVPASLRWLPFGGILFRGGPGNSVILKVSRFQNLFQGTDYDSLCLGYGYRTGFLVEPLGIFPTGKDGIRTAFASAVVGHGCPADRAFQKSGEPVPACGYAAALHGAEFLFQPLLADIVQIGDGAACLMASLEGDAVPVYCTVVKRICKNPGNGSLLKWVAPLCFFTLSVQRRAMAVLSRFSRAYIRKNTFYDLYSSSTITKGFPFPTAA